VDLGGWIEVVAPLAVALFAVWLGFRSQIIALDRETRKDAYLDAIACLQQLRDLIESGEQVNYAAWSLATRIRKAKSAAEESPETTAAGYGLIHWVVRSREIASRLGLEVDWSQVGRVDDVDWGEDFVKMQGLLSGAFIRERELVRQRFNLAIIHAAAVTRIGVFWVVYRTSSVSQRRTSAILKEAYSRLESMCRWVTEVTTDPRPIEWSRVESSIRNAVTATFSEIGSLGHIELGFVSKREPIPWPTEILAKSRDSDGPGKTP
jgi:hypothetical protein